MDNDNPIAIIGATISFIVAFVIAYWFYIICGAIVLVLFLGFCCLDADAKTDVMVELVVGAFQMMALVACLYGLVKLVKHFWYA